MTPAKKSGKASKLAALLDDKKWTNALRSLMVEKENSILRAWFKYFDLQFTGLLDKQTFLNGLDLVDYSGSIEELWYELDSEQTGCVSLRELSEEDAELWRGFRKWCGVRFLGAADMLGQMLGKADAVEPHTQAMRRSTIFGFRGTSRTSTDSAAGVRASVVPKADPSLVVNLQQWTSVLESSGWTHSHEDACFLFHALDTYDEHLIGGKHLRWLDPEVKRRRLKQEARERASGEQNVKAANRKHRQAALSDFKAFLKKHFGPTYHAWRRALDMDGSMNLQRAELFKVCRQLGWKGDVRTLWQALDNDNTNIAALEELDPRCARQLARLKRWAETKYGHRPVHLMWKAIDKRNKCRLSHDYFCQECKALGLDFKDRELKELAHWLDWQPKKVITIEDVQFLDFWKPPAYLVAEPNEEAANAIRKVMKDKYTHSLRAWRAVMDKDNSNTCNWNEFLSAMKYLKYTSDVAGAWLALDHDLSGAISLGEVDPQSNDLLISFKRWCDAEFGSVRSAFKVLDKDKSSELTIQEFRLAIIQYGYTGPEILLFKSLDANSQGRLSLPEVVFLDDWELPPAEEDDGGMSASEGADEKGRRSSLGVSGELSMLESESMYDYQTDGPGPGSYDILSGFAALPRMPTARHGGCWTFPKRPATSPWLGTLQSVGPSATDIAADVSAVQRRKPAWSFGFGNRTPRRVSESPGPGSYEAESAFQGPKFSIGCRRGGIMHPLAKPVRKVKQSHTARSTAHSHM